VPDFELSDCQGRKSLPYFLGKIYNANWEVGLNVRNKKKAIDLRQTEGNAWRIGVHRIVNGSNFVMRPVVRGNNSGDKRVYLEVNSSGFGVH
jgi:hypothetical protein